MRNACVVVRLIAFTAVFACLPYASIAQVSSTTEASDVIQGTVFNSVTHAPIPRALVAYGQEFAALTDGDGHFEFTNASPGTYRLTARKPGYIEGRNGVTEIMASPGNEVTLELVPEALIIGRVILSTGEAAAGVSVQIFSRQVQSGMFRWISGQQVHANSNGEFRFAELEAGTYKVLTHEYMDSDFITDSARKQLYGYPPVYYPIATAFALGNVIQVIAGETFQADISIVRHPYFSVKIPVANPPESNFGLGVSVSPAGDRSPGYSLGYDRRTQSITGSLPDGNYLVEATSYAPEAKSGNVNLAVTGASSQPPVMVLTPNSSIDVNVREEFASRETNSPASFGVSYDGLHGPRAYLNLTAESADDFVQRSGRLRPPAGRDGDSLVIENLRPGTYWLNARSGDGYVASATLGGLDLLHHPFAVSAGAAIPIEITVRDDFAEIDGSVAGVKTQSQPSSASVQGTVFAGSSSFPFASGAPAYIYCVPLSDSSGHFVQIGVDSEGQFNFSKMAPGGYRIMAFSKPQLNLPYRDTEAMKAYEAKGQVVHLSPGQKTTIELQLIVEGQ
jgi:hypothetical protein